MDKLIKYIIESKFNFNIDISDNISLNRLRSLVKSLLQSYKESPIDLKLPSGTLWLPYNLGVNPLKLDTPNDWYGKIIMHGLKLIQKKHIQKKITNFLELEKRKF